MRHHIRCALTGTARERGLTHGTQLAAEISAFYERYLALGQGISANSTAETALLRRAEAYWPAIADWDADLADEMTAVAEGARLDLAKILVLNCYDEFGLDAANGPAGHCTGFAVAAGSSGSTSPLIGQNWDIPRWYEPCVLFHIAEAPGQLETFVLSHPGILGGPGMTHHLALCWMTVLPVDAVIGVPGSLLTRRALTATTVDDALNIVIGARRASGQNLILADAHRVVNIETTAGAHRVTEVATTWAHANHYRDPGLQALEVPGEPIWSSTSRMARMESLFADRREPVETVAAFTMLRDHDGFPSSICEHEEMGHEAETLASVVMSPGEGRLLVSFGPPCSNAPDQLTLQTLGSAVT